ncbi:MAG: helix-turn-helix transcriptional regulator, partial [Rubrobacter sp.]|nr:helix-turn-helix transcriptional regulator [Rubrobacter sp.]
MSEDERQRKRSNGSKLRGNGARPRNWLEPVILVSLREWNSYGYELMERAASFGFEAMNPGTMYRTLRHMEKNGIVKSKWETPKGGPARRVYYITDAGEAYLGFWVNSLKQYQQAIDVFFRIYTGGPRRKVEEKG